MILQKVTLQRIRQIFSPVRGNKHAPCCAAPDGGGRGGKKKVRHGCEEEEAFRMEKRCLFFKKKNEIQSFTRKLGLNLKDAKTFLSPLIHSPLVLVFVM